MCSRELANWTWNKKRNKNCIKQEKDKQLNESVNNKLLVEFTGVSQFYMCVFKKNWIYIISIYYDFNVSIFYNYYFIFHHKTFLCTKIFTKTRWFICNNLCKTRQSVIVQLSSNLLICNLTGGDKWQSEHIFVHCYMSHCNSGDFSLPMLKLKLDEFIFYYRKVPVHKSRERGGIISATLLHMTLHINIQ